ncbi:Uncharacterised protein [Vibrio cholerae]|nr:Uncharacterised protein [Vibrio cholerae]CSD84289.1 Uncharacterised protein [Vibrio cholerae]
MHTDIGNVLDVLTQNIFIKADHRTVFEQVFCPLFLLFSGFFEQIEAFLLTLFCHLQEGKIIHAVAQ